MDYGRCSQPSAAHSGVGTPRSPSLATGWVRGLAALNIAPILAAGGAAVALVLRSQAASTPRRPSALSDGPLACADFLELAIGAGLQTPAAISLSVDNIAPVPWHAWSPFYVDLCGVPA